MIRDCIVSPQERLTAIDETKREKRLRLFEDSFENNHEAATSDIDERFAGNQPVRGISPVQIDMKEVFALLVENELQLRGAEGRETSENLETDADREVSYFSVITVRRSCGKVMFLHLSFILFTGGVCPSACLDTHPPGQTPPSACWDTHPLPSAC